HTLVSPDRRKEYDQKLPPELRSWGEEEEMEVEIDLTRSNGHTPRLRKPSGAYAMGKFGVEIPQEVVNSVRSSVVRARPVAEVMKNEREKHQDWRIVKMTIVLTAVVVALTAVALSIA